MPVFQLKFIARGIHIKIDCGDRCCDLNVFTFTTFNFNRFLSFLSDFNRSCLYRFILLNLVI